MSTLQSVLRNLNASSSAGQNTESTSGPTVATVLYLLGLGLVGTVSNLGLLLAAMRPPLALPALPDPLASALANLAAAGLVESTVNASLSAYYVSGGFSSSGRNSAAATGKAVMLGSLTTASTGMTWGITGVLGATLPGTSLNRVRLGALIAWFISFGLGIATEISMNRNEEAIINSPIIPRSRLVNVSSGLRYSTLALGFVLPWLLTHILGARQAYLRLTENKIRQRKEASIVSKHLTLHDFVATLGALLIHVALHLPHVVSTLVSGYRSRQVHAALAVCRFTHAAVSPMVVLAPAGRLSILWATLLKCCPLKPRPAVSPPPPAHPARALLRQVAMVQPHTTESVPIITPVIFPTPGGLFLRIPRLRGTQSSTPGFSYRNADVTVQSPITEPSRGSLERRDVFLRRF